MIFENTKYYLIPGYDKYYVSKCGKILSCRRENPTLMKPWLNDWGYHRVQLYYEKSKRKTILVHRIVAKTFLENYTEDLEVDHIDGNKINNNVNNLIMANRFDNQRNLHKFLGGLQFHTKNRIIVQWNEQKINEPRIQKNKSFNINKYGFAFAFIMAFDYREKKVKEFYNRPK